MCVQELNSEYMQVYYATAVDLPHIDFAVTQDSEVITKYGLTYDVVLLLKRVILTAQNSGHCCTKW